MIYLRTSRVSAASPPVGFFASPSGSAAGAGTIASPWDLQTALDGGFPAATVQPGDTVWMRGGVYYGTDGTGGRFQLNISGSLGPGVDDPGGKIQFRSYPGEWAILDPIDPGTGHCPTTGMTVILGISGDYVWFRDFEIRSSDTSRVTSDTGSFPAQIIAWGQGATIASNPGYGVGAKLIYIVGHDTIGGTGLWADAVNGEIYGCINYYNGWLVSAGGDRNHGHNTYCQSNTAQRQRCTISWASCDSGAQIYGSGAAFVIGYDFNNNIIFSSGEPGPANGYYGYAENFVSGAGTCHDNTFDSNCQYTYGGASYPTSQNGKTDQVNGTANIVYTNNYVTNGAYSQLQFFNAGATTITGNFFSTGHVVDAGGLCGYHNNGSALYPLSPANTFVESPTADLEKPTTNFIKVIPADAYEIGRGHVAVYNWEGLASVNVDISTFMPVGANYAVYAGQNPLGAAIATGTYGGGTISLSTAAQTVATPVGMSAVSATGPEFNAFIIRKV